MRPFVQVGLVLMALFLSAGCRGGGSPSTGPLANLERSMVFQPAKYPAGNWQPVALDFEDAWFQAADGTRLHGWYCPHPAPRAVVLLTHGNAGNITHRAGVLRRLNHEHGLAVMTFDYRGYGRSEGTPNEEGILQDARAARAWLAARANLPQRDIVLMGRSLGGAVAVDLAANDGARGLILQSTFTSLPDVASDHVWWVPTGLIMRNRLDSRGKLDRYHGPLLISHGDADRVIPCEHGRRLFEVANLPKRFVPLPGAGHNDPQTREYYVALDEFIDSLPGTPPETRTRKPCSNVPAD
jgi:fermentation-respiration switch protein FrsA (DUF1100 family)